MFSTLRPPTSGTIYYLAVTDFFQNVAASLAKKSGLQKVTFQVLNDKTHERTSFSGWSDASLEKMLLFGKALEPSVSLREISHFLSYGGGRVHPCHMSFKIRDGREQKKFEKFEREMKAKPP